MTELDKTGYEAIRMAAVTTSQFTAMPPSLSASVKRFDDAMAVDQNSSVPPADMTTVTSVQSMQRNILRQIILYGVKPEADE